MLCFAGGHAVNSLPQLLTQQGNNRDAALVTSILLEIK